jgi:uncharacterized RDD family membrane protein YckC
MATDATEFPPVDASPPAEGKLAGRVFAGFWARLAAFLIHYTIVGAVGFVLGLALWGTFVALRGLAPLVGLVLVLAYVGTMSSVVGGGQTVGKRAFRLRVVGRDGRCIGLGRSLARTALLWAPLTANRMWFTPHDPVWPDVLRNIILLGLGGPLAYLYVFNVPQRRPLHDLICRTFVVRADGTGPVAARPVARVHVAIGWGWALFVALFCIYEFGAPLATTGLLGELNAAQSAIYADPSVSRAGLNLHTQYPGGETSFLAQVWYAKRPASYDAPAREIARTVLKTCPSARSASMLFVRMSDGWDLGVARLDYSFTLHDTPDRSMNAARPGYDAGG